jgi:hypothetical protein
VLLLWRWRRLAAGHSLVGSRIGVSHGENADQLSYKIRLFLCNVMQNTAVFM